MRYRVASDCHVKFDTFEWQDAHIVRRSHICRRLVRSQVRCAVIDAEAQNTQLLLQKFLLSLLPGGGAHDVLDLLLNVWIQVGLYQIRWWLLALGVDCVQLVHLFALFRGRSYLAKRCELPVIWKAPLVLRLPLRGVVRLIL